MRERVLVGLSGGVDSSVAAALLIEQGYEVVAGFMKNWSETKDITTQECSWRSDRRDAMRVAARFNIPLLTFDFERAYRERVIRRLTEESRIGLTPNPDVLCNEEIKFGLFAEKAFALGFDRIATGHYARSRIDAGGIAWLLRGMDAEKDQSYFLHRISQNALKRTLFPIGHLYKSQVREQAARRKLPTASKPDSQGICFIGKQDYHAFLRTMIPSSPGPIITPDGTIIGTHDGLDAYTIGQRQGLGIYKEGAAWYVAAKEPGQNRLIVVPDREHPLLYRRQAEICQMHWISGPLPVQSEVDVAIRYRQKAEPATFMEANLSGGSRLSLHFLRPVWALAPGQSAVLYQKETCLGGGFITYAYVTSSYGPTS